MATPRSRRQFLKLSVLTAAATWPRFAIGQPGPSANGKINVACLGLGHQAFWVTAQMLLNPHVQVVALCEVDDRMFEYALAKAVEFRAKGMEVPDLAAIPRHRDYREMIQTLGDRIDAITVATPDHHHFPAAMLAIQRGKHVFVEKPLTHSIGEARALLAASRRHGVVTQMGNQGRASEGIRLIKEWVDAGVLGRVREVHAWAPSFNEPYFTRPSALPLVGERPPPGLDWDLWLGPAAERDYSPVLLPQRWRGWWDFGTGMLGDWGCHTLDAPFWALDLGAPESVEAQLSEPSPTIVPHWAEVTYRFAARPHRPPVVLKWFEGSDRLPPVPTAWERETPLPVRGMFMFGDRATLFAPNGRPDSPRLLETDKMEELKRERPARTLPRVTGGHFQEWIDAIRGVGPKPGSNFEYAVPLSEMVLLGALAVRTGARIEWDPVHGRVKNDPALNRFVEIQARPGWRV